MTTRYDILTQLKTDLEDKLKISNGYSREPSVVTMGISNFEDHETKPVISFFAYSDEIQDEELGTDSRLRILNILIYAYDDIHNNDYEAFFDFIEDVEKFIDSTDWTYENNTMMSTPMNFVPSADNTKVMFDFSIRVFYQQDV